ncbi:hypothetical protein BZA77DRAFT_270845 [Pyronema omphalodes]|nr:hypothetical protein BZA77DRAFT_270845 [Pyronema omphalodes]
MKFVAGLVASGLATLAAASTAAIYELNNIAPSGPVLEVSPDQARLGLALALGVSRFYKLNVQGDSDTTVAMLEQFGSEEHRVGISPEDDSRFLLSVAGMEPGDVNGLNTPLMVMKNAPSTESTGLLMRELAEEKAETISTSLQEVASLDSSFCSAAPAVRDAESHLSNYKTTNYNTWSLGRTSNIITKEIVKTFSPDRPEDRRFVSEYLLFKGFTDKIIPQLSEEKHTAFCHLTSLQELISAYGEDSKQALLAHSLYEALLQKLSGGNVKTTLLLTPGVSGKAAFTIQPHPKRAHEAVSSGVPAAQKKPPTTPKPAPIGKGTRYEKCYDNEESCNNSTASCSGHGKCRKSGKDCWSCTCKPTVLQSDEQHKSTTYWAGYACQKKDISVPFNLFLIFSITIVLVIAWAVSLLASIGETELPSVLSAGVAPPKRA